MQTFYIDFFPNLSTSGPLVLVMADLAYSVPSTAPSSSDTAPDSALCIMSFNALDAVGGLGLTADAITIASVGAHPVTVACCIQVSDTNRIFSHTALDDELVADQARTVLEDMPVQAFKVGFVGSTANISTIASICSDYPEIPVISYMPDLSWWQEGDALEEYLDAFEELLLPQTTILVGNHGTLARWLLPQWEHSRAPTPRDIAQAAQAQDVPFVLVTGIAQHGDFFDNVLANAETVIGSSKFEFFDAKFLGAGETASAALAALLAAGNDLGAAAQEALEYMDHCLGNAFHPGMGRLIPDRMFWAQPEDKEDKDDAPEQQADASVQTPDNNALPAANAGAPDSLDDVQPPAGFTLSRNDTEH